MCAAFVHKNIAAAIERAKPDLEQFINEHLECPELVPLTFTKSGASIVEIRAVKVTPRFASDYPQVDVVVATVWRRSARA